MAVRLIFISLSKISINSFRAFLPSKCISVFYAAPMFKPGCLALWQLKDVVQPLLEIGKAGTLAAETLNELSKSLVRFGLCVI